jgi:murein DD-endopeptidase MepM/ murein hydrolase activator NlpD
LEESEASEDSDPESESEEAGEAESDTSEAAEPEIELEDSETQVEDAEPQAEAPTESGTPTTSEASTSAAPDVPDSGDTGDSGSGGGTEPTHPRPTVKPPQKHDRSADGQLTVTTSPTAQSWQPDPTWGTYSTAGLVRVADRLRRQGWRRAEIARRVFAPFPVEGLAAWSDTWGAPRYAGGYHPHHGQDLLCAEGTPLLAVQSGTVQFHADPLGGTTILLVRGDGSFWYYAHLSAYAHNLQSGASIERGQMIGFCGATGDATISHLHFALFDATGNAIDPMPHLLRWLHAAERRSDLRASTGRDLSIPDTNGSESGDGPPAIPFPAHGAEADSGTGAMMAAPFDPTQLSVRPGPGVRLGVVAAVAMLLLPLPLASRRVRRRVLRSVR